MDDSKYLPYLTKITMQADSSSNRLTEKDQYFRDFTVWPVVPEFNTEAWLSNFSSDEKPVAERLLINFSYFNERMTDALLRAAIQNYFCQEEQISKLSSKNVNDYISQTAFVLCEGERPHPTDSGNLFSRKLRDKLLIPENNIMLSKEALRRKIEFRRFIFVDDFSGSGNQFEATWNRNHEIHGRYFSFQNISQFDKHVFAYCCCISTSKANDKIVKVAPAVTLSSAHQLHDRHSAVHQSSSIWQDMDMQSAQSIIKNASFRAGYSAEDGSQEDWRGFRKLGLTLAFNHGIPDSSLPLFFSQRDNWKPLMIRADV